MCPAAQQCKVTPTSKSIIPRTVQHPSATTTTTRVLCAAVRCCLITPIHVRPAQRKNMLPHQAQQLKDPITLVQAMLNHQSGPPPFHAVRALSKPMLEQTVQCRIRSLIKQPTFTASTAIHSKQQVASNPTSNFGSQRPYKPCCATLKQLYMPSCHILSPSQCCCHAQAGLPACAWQQHCNHTCACSHHVRWRWNTAVLARWHTGEHCTTHCCRCCRCPLHSTCPVESRCSAPMRLSNVCAQQ